MHAPRVVVVVDDDNRIVESLQNLLESAGYTAHGFVSAQALLGSPVWRTLDLLITDIGMPEIDGFALCRRLRRDRPGTPVFLITGCGEQQLQETEGLGVSVLFKPVDADELLSSIEQKLDGR